MTGPAGFDVSKAPINFALACLRILPKKIKLFVFSASFIFGAVSACAKIFGVPCPPSTTASLSAITR
jgi:hypothetical protein